MKKGNLLRNDLRIIFRSINSVMKFLIASSLVVTYWKEQNVGTE